MTSFTEWAKRTGKLVTDNSPVILTAVSVVGTLTTAYLTGRATQLYMQELAEEGYHDRDYTFGRTSKEHFQRSWRLYVPAALTASVTISTIVGANRIGSRRAAALAAAYALSERAFDEYKIKIIEKIGERKEQTIRDEIAQERVARDPVTSREVIVAGSGSVLCYESFTGRYFTSDIETLRKAQNDVNYQVLNDSYASLSDFYSCVGLPLTKNSDEVGWNADKMLELKFSTTLSDDNRPCIVVDFAAVPIRHYSRLQ